MTMLHRNKWTIILYKSNKSTTITKTKIENVDHQINLLKLIINTRKFKWTIFYKQLWFDLIHHFREIPITTSTTKFIISRLLLWQLYTLELKNCPISLNVLPTWWSISLFHSRWMNLLLVSYCSNKKKVFNALSFSFSKTKWFMSWFHHHHHHPNQRNKTINSSIKFECWKFYPLDTNHSSKEYMPLMLLTILSLWPQKI